MKNLLSVIWILCLSYSVLGQAGQMQEETILSGYEQKIIRFCFLDEIECQIL